MSSSSESLPPGYFENVYGASADPWGFRSSAYERHKYQRTLAALPRERFDRGLEIGCSIGVLSRQLAPRCGQLLALDINDSALRTARHDAAEAGIGNVQWLQMQLPQSCPAGAFDLILVSEVAYYWSMADLGRAADWMVQALNAAGAIVLVHWTDPVADYPLTGNAVHDHFIELAAQGRLRHRYGEWHPRYRIDTFDAAGTLPPAHESPESNADG